MNELPHCAVKQMLYLQAGWPIGCTDMRKRGSAFSIHSFLTGETRFEIG